MANSVGYRGHRSLRLKEDGCVDRCPFLCLLLTQVSGELRLTKCRTNWSAAPEVFVKKRFALEAKVELAGQSLAIKTPALKCVYLKSILWMEGLTTKVQEQ